MPAVSTAISTSCGPGSAWEPHAESKRRRTEWVQPPGFHGVGDDTRPSAGRAWDSRMSH